MVVFIIAIVVAIILTIKEKKTTRTQHITCKQDFP